MHTSCKGTTQRNMIYSRMTATNDLLGLRLGQSPNRLATLFLTRAWTHTSTFSATSAPEFTESMLPTNPIHSWHQPCLTSTIMAFLLCEYCRGWTLVWFFAHFSALNICRVKRRCEKEALFMKGRTCHNVPGVQNQ